MTPDGLLIFAGLLIVVSRLTAALVGRAFCLRPAPAAFRTWSDLALALGGARLVAGRLMELPIDYATGLIWLNVGLAGACIAVWNIQHAMGPRGGRCS
jgi:hypothetical protein